MTYLRAIVRLWLLALHILRGLWILRYRFPHLDQGQQDGVARHWSGQALRIMGVHLQVLGEPPVQGPLLVLSNHISWLDVVVMSAARPCRFVSKADVRHWPVMGALIAGAGTLFIDRTSRRDAARVVADISERLRAGDLVALFPEGTTSEGREVLPFHGNLLQSALQVDCPIQPVGMVYLRGQGHALLGEAPRHDAPVYTGGMSLGRSIWRIVCARELQATVHWGEPDSAQGRDRRTWAEAVRTTVARLADLPLSERSTKPSP